jgi:hypothetical protein
MGLERSFGHSEVRSVRSLPGSGHIATELGDELLNGEIFCGLKEAQVVIE